jgi:hypothetical protein
MNQPALYLTAPLAFAPAEADALPTRLTGVAYSGGPVSDWGGTVVVDLASTRVEPTLPLLHEHQREAVIGTVRQLANDGQALALDAELFSDLDPAAESIARKAQRGLHWQLSIGLFDAAAEEIRTGAVHLNGQTFTAPVTVLRHGLVREVSVVALGADRATQADFFAALARPPSPPETRPMSDAASDAPDLTARIAALEAQVADLTTALDAAHAAQAAAEATAAEVQLAARQAAVQALFAELNRAYSDAAAAHYLSLPETAWTAIAADLRAAKPSVPAHLFREQATGAPATQPPRPALDTTAIYAARRAS